MKRAMFSALAVVVLTALCGCRVCQHRQGPYSCSGDSCAPATNGPSCCDSCGSNNNDPNNCSEPGRRHLLPLCRGEVCEEAAEQPAAAPGPPAAAITYPYYTVRGPRDFLAKNPPSIGP